ncbi:MAG TPA: molybdate ABC transporter substrate-binding protein, partial [Armatimonadota bacterium]|nr:molybdate ABC transporter substrate-binding protein [Armatimonadota bacterium]
MRRRLGVGAVAGLALAMLLPARAAGPVQVYAAASLTDAFNALRPEFERANPGTTVRFNFGASSTLRTQIEQGAPADVFASADRAQMEPLVGGKLVETPARLAGNRLVVVLPSSNPGRIASLKDLARPGMKVVATAASVPIGRYTQEVLRKLGRMPGYPAGYAAAVERNIVSREPNVRSVLAKVELGEADAAFVYETDGKS